MVLAFVPNAFEGKPQALQGQRQEALHRRIPGVDPGAAAVLEHLAIKAEHDLCRALSAFAPRLRRKAVIAHARQAVAAATSIVPAHHQAADFGCLTIPQQLHAGMRHEACQFERIDALLAAEHQPGQPHQLTPQVAGAEVGSLCIVTVALQALRMICGRHKAAFFAVHLPAQAVQRRQVGLGHFLRRQCAVSPGAPAAAVEVGRKGSRHLGAAQRQLHASHSRQRPLTQR